MVYQEQVMRIASSLAGFTLGEADILRKAMGKKKADVMAAQMDKFVKGCVARGIAEKKARRIWDQMEQFAGYGFNKSHSAAYAFLAYQTGYLKANFPLFFMAALLTSERANTDKMVSYIGECREMSIRVLAPDVNESDIFFTVVGDGIRFGLSAIKNVGEGAVEAVLAARRASGPFRSLSDFCERVDLRAVNRRVVESFIKSGSFDSLSPRRAALLAAVERTMESGQRRQRDQEQGQASLFGMLAGQAVDTPGPAPDALPETPEWGEAERLAFEKESLGFFITGHPLERVKDELRQWTTVTIAGLAGLTESREVSVGGLTSALRLLKTKKGDRMATFVLEDLDGTLEVLVFPETYSKVALRLADDQVVVVKGKAEAVDEGKPRLLASEVLSLEQTRLSEARRLTVRVPLALWDRNKGERLRDILGARQGDCSVLIELTRPDAPAVTLAPSARYRVRPDAGLRDEIEALFGAGSVRYSRTNGGR